MHPDGQVYITVPHYSNSIRWPDHNNHFSMLSFEELFDKNHSMYLDTGMKIVEKELRWTTQKRTVKGRFSRLMTPLIAGRLAPYFDLYFWPFVGGIQEVAVVLEPH